MAFLTLDLSTTCTGWAIFNDDNTIRCFGNIQPPKHTAKNPVDTNDRIYYMYSYVYKLINKFSDIDKVVWEEQFGGKNGQVGLILSRVRGALIPIFMFNRIKIVEDGYANNSIKKAVTGNGKATKEMMAEAVIEYFKYDERVQAIGPVIEKPSSVERHKKNDDIYDALGIGITYIKRTAEESENG